VPVDVDDPPARRETVLADASARTLVTQARRGGEFTWFEGPIVHVDRLSPQHDNHPHQVPQALTGDHVAYVIYTSGSTGAPKGVMVRHSSIASLIAAAGQVLPFGPGDVWTLAHASAFDFSVWELWGPLLSGGRVLPVPRETARDPRRLWHLMCTEQVTMLSATPSALHQLDPADVDFRDSTLRAVVLGGERCDPRRLAGWLAGNRPTMLNMYGITETTVHVTSRRLTAADVSIGGSPIGRALPGQRMHVVDGHGVPVAAGGRGELLVGGTGVARGYLGRPGLTADRFRPDHLGGEPGARLYRSGDLGRLLPDGAVDYLGRLDDQLKVRGYRIEPAEIEAALAGHPDVAAAAAGVTVAGDQRQVLTAYVVPATPTAGIRLSSRDLRRFLAERLPPHLVPASYVVLGQLPLTRNGKLDRAALAATPVAAGAVAESDRPHTATEGTLAELWRDLLGLPAVGVHDDFFDIGGDSLAVTRLHARLPALFGVELPMRRLYHALTIEAQAAVIDDLLTVDSPGSAS
jgi:amino acid adenylation domain-containing protein